MPLIPLCVAQLLVLLLQVLAASSLQETPAGDVNWVMALPTVVSNMHDYFVATAAKLERTHTEVRLLSSSARGVYAVAVLLGMLDRGLMHQHSCRQ